jgi:hypothetical protein
LRRAVVVDGETTTGQQSSGRGRLFEIADGHQMRLTVRDTQYGLVSATRIAELSTNPRGGQFRPALRGPATPANSR